jgi:cell division protein ZapB
MANSSTKLATMQDALDAPMSAQIDAVIERTERLLLRHEELTRTNALLLEQLDALNHERDTLKSRLAAARSRIDALIERLPEQPTADVAAS